MIRSLLLCMFLLPLTLAGCTSARLENPPPMAIRAGLSTAQVEASIDQAIRDANRRSAWAGGMWAVESREPGKQILGLRVRQHYLQLAIHYDATQFNTRIIGSRNLDQDRNSIHRKALAWQRRLEADIYRQLYLQNP